MKKKTTVLSIAPAMLPLSSKPTRTEIARAMLERAKEKWAEKDTELQEKKKTVRLAIEKLALQEAVSGNYSTSYIDEPSRYDSSSLVHVQLDVTSPEIGKLCQEYRQLCKACVYFDEAAVKKQINAKLFCPEARTHDILAVPENVRAIDAILENIRLT